MTNVQTEVLELEFNEFARGMPTITEVEFAHILLRYTILSKEDHAEYIQRLQQRIPDAKVCNKKTFYSPDCTSLAIFTHSDSTACEAMMYEIFEN